MHELKNDLDFFDIQALSEDLQSMQDLIEDELYRRNLQENGYV